MKKTFAILSATLALTAAAPALAGAAGKTSFTHDGVTYTYKTTQAGKSTIIEGYAAPGDKFRLVKSGNQVTGKMNGVAVSFRMDQLVDARPSGAIPLALR